MLFSRIECNLVNLNEIYSNLIKFSKIEGNLAKLNSI